MPIHVPTTQTAEQLKELGADFVRIGGEIAAIAAAVKEAGFESLSINNYDQVKRAREYAENYVHAIKRAMREAREVRGDFAKQTKASKKGQK